MGGLLAPERASRRRCYDEIRHLMLVVRIALGWAIGWADEWGRFGEGWGEGIHGSLAPSPRAGEGWGEGALRLGRSGCRQHFFQGLGGEHPLGPAQQGVGVGRFDKLLEGDGLGSQSAGAARRPGQVRCPVCAKYERVSDRWVWWVHARGAAPGGWVD